MGDSISSRLREHKISQRRSLKGRYFPEARIASIKHYPVPFLMNQPERIILHIGIDDAPFLAPEIMFKELKELRNFIFISLPDVKLIFSTPVLRTGNSNANENNKHEKDFLIKVEKLKYRISTFTSLSTEDKVEDSCNTDLIWAEPCETTEKDESYVDLVLKSSV